MVGHNLVPRILVNFPDASAEESTIEASLSFISSENWNLKLGDLLQPLLNNNALTKPA